MKLSDALEQIQISVRQMGTSYGGVLFDEWAIVSLKAGGERMVSYAGPRREDFQKNLTVDLGTLRAELLTARHDPGYYNFARDAAGTGVEAFVCIGEDLYLICNNTQRSMDEITRNPRWLEAQKAFAALTERFSRDAVTL